MNCVFRFVMTANRFKGKSVKILWHFTRHRVNLKSKRERQILKCSVVIVTETKNNQNHLTNSLP